MDTLLYLGALRLTYSKQTLLCSVFDSNVSTSEKEKFETQLIAIGSRTSHYQRGWRLKVSLDTSRPLHMCLIFDGELNCLIATVARNQVAEGQAHNLLSDAAQFLRNNANTSDLEGEPLSLSRVMKEPFRSLMKAHSKNSVRNAQEKVDVVKDAMRANMSKMVQNVDNLASLDEKARDLEEGAKDYQLHTRGVRKQALMQKYQWAALGVLCFVILAFLILHLKRSQGSSTSSPENLDA
eukprot:GEMP01031415.1.p1 GENE.GEMP01031415.1~~GEMP01031415.1.p1  ORF type:complete len:238 (+),score=43.67 GEMP01031415.1:61-774(+)